MYGNIIRSDLISKVMNLLFKDFICSVNLYFLGFHKNDGPLPYEFHISQDFSAWNSNMLEPLLISPPSCSPANKNAVFSGL